MNRLALASFCATAFFLAACQGKKEHESASVAAEETPYIDTPTVMATPTVVVDTPIPINQVTPATQQLPLQTTNASSEALNPPHGQPGHRCEIPVGAPLSTAPPQPTTVAPGQSLQLPTAAQGSVTQKVELQSSPSGNGTTNMVASPATPTTTAPGMNPPHGQPGHDCNIPVGAPLKK